MNEISEQDLVCIARKFQKEMFPYEVSGGGMDAQCVLCKYADECYSVDEDGNIIQYRRNFNRLLGKLEKITGVYLGKE